MGPSTFLEENCSGENENSSYGCFSDFSFLNGPPPHLGMNRIHTNALHMQYSLPSHRVCISRRDSTSVSASPVKNKTGLNEQSSLTNADKEKLQNLARSNVKLIPLYNYFTCCDVPLKLLGKPKFLTTDTNSPR